MEISPRKPSKRTQEPVDEWLQNEGYFRKHAPRDPTCLFRAVSEQVYLTQYYHIRVRKECIEFMRNMKHLFVECITIPFESYLEQMACFTEWGSMNEIQAMSLLYKKEFVIFNGQKQTRRTVTNNGFKDTIYLCHTPQKQYESIYTRDFVAVAAYCQSVVYQVLYKDVFNMANIESTVHKMLHDRSATFRHDKFFLKGNLELRDQLTAEMYTRVENGHDEVDDAQSVMKGVPPFPYRVAKALDPNIYRNTDFDIWHEIRREVKNAGWTRHNSHELQIGGKCLVQMDFNEEESDKANNNTVFVSPVEKDPNGNDTKLMQKKLKQDPIFLCGHIQEMSKNQGPVLVFIEELGEKRTVPYAALKPLPLRKSKQSNWLPLCKRNIFLDSNQKWKKTCSPTSRKMKDTMTTVNILSNGTDKNGNNSNNMNDVNKNNYQVNQWNEESIKVEHQQTYENYAMEKCSNYTVSSSPDIFPTLLDNSDATLDNAKHDVGSECKENASSFMNHNSDNGAMTKASKSGALINNDNSTEFNSHSKQRVQKDVYYPPYSGEQTGGNQMDRMLRSINCSVQKSVDVNGSDLPLSDPFTLRFFYNLGLEYFRVSHTWNYVPNGQAVGFGQWYPGAPQNEPEMGNIPNNMAQEGTVAQYKPEHSNDRKENGNESLLHENSAKSANGVKEVPPQKAESQRDCGKELPHDREKMKEHAPGNKDSQRSNRNGLAPRFKRNSDNRYRQSNANQPPPTQQQVHNGNQYQHCGQNPGSPKPHDAKYDSVNSQYSNSVPHQVHVPPGAPSSYHAPYVPQNIYTGVPYYASEAEGFVNPYYGPNPGFYPFPCLSHSDMPENNNVQPFSPHMCPGVEYQQAYPGLCPPYMCPQPPPYNIPAQSMQEHWYAVPGQPHYMQYAPIIPLTPDATCSGIGQNISPNISS